VAAYVLESLVPTPLPWVRLGLSNVVVLVVLFAFGFRDAFIVNLVRIVGGNALTGLLLGPAFLFSIVGSTSALLVMGFARWKLVPPLSVTGTSVLGAVTSNAAQVLVFTALFAPAGAARNLAGIFILIGTGTGVVTGVVAAAVLAKVRLARHRALS
jgi:heptaprenyl diphosphate synthase